MASETAAMEHTLTPVAGPIEQTEVDQINRRYAGTQHRVLWNGQDLECHFDRHARKAVSEPELRRAVDALIDAGCVRPPSAVETSPEEVTFQWTRVGKLTYPWEWPAEGWRAAAITTLRALEVLRSQNLTLRAPQPGDLFMVGSRLTIANLGGVMRWSAEVESRTIEQLERQFVRPVECATHGRAGLARRLLRGDVIAGLSSEDRDILLGPTKVQRHSMSGTDQVEIDRMIEWLTSITFPLQSARGESWQSYEARMTRGRSDEIAAKSAAVLSIVDRVRPNSVLDMGCNLGLFSQLAANQGALVSGVDGDEDCLNLFFTRASAWEEPATAVLTDLSDPSPGHGWGNGWIVPAAQRLPSDLVITFALIHHLAQKARIRADELRACFSSLTKRWFLLEFVPLGPTNPFTWGADHYSLDWFLDAIGDSFVRQHSWHHGDRDRTLLLFERRERARG